MAEKEYIEREALLKHFQFRIPVESEVGMAYKECVEIGRKLISEAPTADVVEVVHGEWKKQKPNIKVMQEFHDKGLGKAMGENSIFWTCSCCGGWGTPYHKYCSNCGAKMDGKGDAE